MSILNLVESKRTSKHVLLFNLRDLRYEMLKNGVSMDSALVGYIVTAAIYWTMNCTSNWIGAYYPYGLVLIRYC